MARLQDPSAHLDSQAQAIVQQLIAKRGSIGELYRVMLNHPTLVQHVGSLGAFLRYEGVLPGAVREASILMVAFRMRAEYEWEKHVEPSEHAGVPDALRKAISEGGDLTSFGAPYQDIQLLVGYVLGNHELPNELQTRLETDVTVQGLIELVILVGFYRMIAGFISAFSIQPPQLPHKYHV